MTILILIAIEIALFTFGATRGNKSGMESLMRGNTAMIILFAGKLMMIGGLITNIGTVLYATVVAGQMFILEKYGFNQARQVMNSIIYSITNIFMVGIGIYYMPIIAGNDVAYSINAVLDHSWRIIAASYLAFYIAQSLMLYLWYKYHSKGFWFRMILSLVALQAVDSLLFFPTAFGFVSNLTTIIISGFVVKIIIGLLFLPIIKYFKKHE